MSVHEAARLGFERGAEAYERGRPEYPREAIEWLIERLGLGPGRLVVDVGAGTGKLTRALTSSGAELVAVEPVAGMRAVLEREVPDARVLEGTAEALPLTAAEADAIVAGQAFHWFDGPRALSECHRVLHPDGRLGLVWNRRRRAQPLHQQIEAIIAPYREGTPSHRSGRWREAMERTSLFTKVDEIAVPFEQILTDDQFVDRVGSISFIAALETGPREDVLGRIRRLASSGLEPLAYDSEVFIYARVPGEASA
jgi:ubiquinone/menaquinone biosynthesis C-methylase UbiE